MEDAIFACFRRENHCSEPIAWRRFLDHPWFYITLKGNTYPLGGGGDGVLVIIGTDSCIVAWDLIEHGPTSSIVGLINHGRPKLQLFGRKFNLFAILKTKLKKKFSESLQVFSGCSFQSQENFWFSFLVLLWNRRTSCCQRKVHMFKEDVLYSN